MSNNLCPDCQHEAHAPGKCPKDNCGTGDITHSRAMKTDRITFVTWENFRRGEVSTSTVTRINPRKTDH